MRNIAIVRVLAVIIIVYSLIVMVGWIFNINYLTKILNDTSNMKFATAVCFLLSGIALWFIDLALGEKTDFSQVILPATTTLIFLIMATLFISGFLQVQTGIEDLFTPNNGAYANLSPGMPAIQTMLGFILFGIASLLSLFHSQYVNKTLAFISLPISLLGIMAVSGYILKIPILYFSFNTSNTSIAVNTGIVFILLSVGLWQTSRQKISHET